MFTLLTTIKRLQHSTIKKIIDDKLMGFHSLHSAKNNILFQELCFCLLAANFNAEKSLKIQSTLKDQLLTLSEKQLAQKLKELGHRHPNVRAKYIVEARQYNLQKILRINKDENELRNYLVKNVKGLGLKEASHFLRNVGYNNLAIVDFHIVDLLVKNKLIKKPKTITPKLYLQTENILKSLAKKANLNLAELDLYLWYIETGKIIK